MATSSLQAAAAAEAEAEASTSSEHEAHVLEAVDPLAALGALPTDVHHAEDDVVQVERVLDDTSGGHTHAQNVLQRRQVVRRRHAVQCVQVAAHNRRARNVTPSSTRAPITHSQIRHSLLAKQQRMNNAGIAACARPRELLATIQFFIHLTHLTNNVPADQFEASAESAISNQQS